MLKSYVVTLSLHDRLSDYMVSILETLPKVLSYIVN